MFLDSKGKRLTEYLKDYVVFDLETTGTSCYTDKVIEISAIKVKDHEITEEFSSLVNPGQSIPYFASQVNGITDDMVEDAPAFDSILNDFIEFTEGLPLVGHNIQTFDLRFIYRDSMEYYGTIPGNDYVDTLYLSRMCLPELEHHTLSDLAVYYGMSTEGAHRALNDCRMNQAVFEKLGEEIRNAELNAKICPKCGSIMKLRNGMYGEFYGCTGYPVCRYTCNI